MNLPLLSLGIPTYRRPHRLRHLLERLKQQKNITLLNIEIVVSDNHSEDETENVVKEFINELPIRYICQNSNVGSAMNFHALLSLCKGKYLWLVPDDDDFTLPDSVYTIYQKLESNPEISALFLNHRTVELDTGKITRDNVFGWTKDIFIQNGKNIFDTLEDVHLLTGIGVVVNRKMADTPLNLRYCQQTWLSPMSMAVSACAHGPVLITGERLVDLSTGDPASWRTYWSHIYYQEMGELLRECITEFGYPEKSIQKMLRKKAAKKRLGEVMNWKQLLLFSHKLNVFRLFKIYGFIAFYWYLISPWEIIKKRIFSS